MEEERLEQPEFEVNKPRGIFSWLTWKNAGAFAALLIFAGFFVANNFRGEKKQEPTERKTDVQNHSSNTSTTDPGIKAKTDTSSNTGGKGTTQTTGMKEKETGNGTTTRTGGINPQEQLAQERRQFEREAAFKSNIVKFENTRLEKTAEKKAEDAPSERPNPTPRSQSSTQQEASKRDPLAFPEDQAACWLPETTVIDAVLDSSLQGEMTGPVDAHTLNDTYCPNTRQVVLPKGTKISGEAQKISNFGQQRLAVVFHQMQVEPPLGLVRPIYTIPLDEQEPGLDQEGGMGLKAKMNNHTWSLLGAATVVGLIQGASVATYSNGNYSASVGIMNGLSQSTAQTTSRILDRYLNRLPTGEVPSGRPMVLRLVKHKQVPYPEAIWANSKGS